MAWGLFSAEAVTLDSELRKLHRLGKTSGALETIKAALERAYVSGPSMMDFETFEATARAPAGEK